MATNALGLFDAPATALAAAGKLKGAGFDTPSVISPIPLHGAEEVLGEKKSVIKRFSFFGGLFGAMFGFTLAAGTAVLYLHPTGGRPIIAIPPFLIITYEISLPSRWSVRTRTDTDAPKKSCGVQAPRKSES